MANTMNMLTPLLFSSRLAYIFVFLSFIGSGSFLIAEDNIQTVFSPKTRTVVADLLMIDGDLYIVRGERGEIRIEVTPDTQISETFIFGDRIKAVLLPNDVAQSIIRAAPDEPIGITTNDPSEPPPTPTSTEISQTSEEDLDETSPLYKAYQVPKVRIIVADLLMVDGSFYIVRSEYGEIQIEITSETELSEDFKFGDKIKARVTSTDKALSIVRAGKDEPTGIQEETAAPAPSTPIPPVPTPPTKSPTITEQKTPELPVELTPTIRIIVADVLMVDGDFYIVRGERGEIRIEVTPKTKVSEPFDYGDRVKAEVLPNDKALTIERASPDDPIGITTP
jgi:exosome complex RNA-binding protein Csl4